MTTHLICVLFLSLICLRDWAAAEMACWSSLWVMTTTVSIFFSWAQFRAASTLTSPITVCNREYLP